MTFTNGYLDLPIAIGILAASGQISNQILAEYEFGGELALDGTLRPFTGALPFAISAKSSKRKLIVPVENADEGALSENTTVIPANHLLEVVQHLLGIKIIAPHIITKTSTIPTFNTLDIKDICGQEHAKRALEIAAAGQHSLLMLGPPGTGKTMLANRLISILPEMNDEEALETAAINSICGKKFNFNDWLRRPFRSPHHTTSSAALVGGSNPPRPGEISLAHNGILFLDELPEFNRSVLEALREPMESGLITISRAAHQAIFPAKFQLIAAMNPCPCGNSGDNQKDCNCTPAQIARYQDRISGPLLDRIDMHIEVPKLPPHLLINSEQTMHETSAIVRARVISARNHAHLRANKLNTSAANKMHEKYFGLTTKLREYLLISMQKLNCSARSYHKILKIARTIADLESSETIEMPHVQEAMNYRKKNKNHV